MQKVIFTQGQSVDIAVPAAGYLAVWTKGEAIVSRKIGYPNYPNSLSRIGTLDGQNTSNANTPAYQLFGPYASGATLSIENTSGNDVFYSFGLAPVLENALTEVQVTPGVLNVTGALTGAMMATGIVTSTTAAAVAGTLPTGTVMDTNSNFNINDAFDWTVIATGANAFTVTASAGHTVVGAAAVATGTSGNFRTRKTAAATFVTYRMG